MKKIWKQLLLEYCHKKSEIIKELTDIDLYEQEDYEEIENEWSEDMCKKALSLLSLSHDFRCCPWCNVFAGSSHYVPNCEICKYGKRHGNCCKDAESVYGKIETALIQRTGFGSICHNKEIKKLVTNYYREKERRMKK